MTDKHATVETLEVEKPKRTRIKRADGVVLTELPEPTRAKIKKVRAKKERADVAAQETDACPLRKDRISEARKHIGTAISQRPLQI